ncbi:MAG: hypothetical protein VW778_01400 [Betaproteobacteria bacterium]
MTNQIRCWTMTAGLLFLTLSLSPIPVVLAEELTFEEAQIRTVNARKLMERKKKELDMVTLETDSARSSRDEIKRELEKAEAGLGELESKRSQLEGEYETLKKKWAEEASRLRKIHAEERR